MRGLLRVLVVLGTACVCLVLAGGSAAAHADLVASTPREGDVVRPTLGRVELVFASDLVPAATQLVVEGPEGDLLETGRVTVSGPLVSLGVARLDEGPHAVVYRATSADGHPVAGRLEFTVARTGTAPAEGDVGGTSPTTASGGAPGAVPVGAWWVVGVLLLATLVILRRAPADPQMLSSSGSRDARPSSSPRTPDSDW